VRGLRFIVFAPEPTGKRPYHGISPAGLTLR
jgi:hypothetical protein